MTNVAKTPVQEVAEAIEKIAQEQFTNQVEREAFIEAFNQEMLVKSANFFTNVISQPGFREEATKGAVKAGFGLAAGLLGAGIVKGIHSVSSTTANYFLKNKFELALQQVMGSNKFVKAQKPEKVKSYAETIFKFAPHVACDPNILAYYLANVLQGEGIDITTMKTLTDLEGRYQDNNSSNPLLGIKV